MVNSAPPGTAEDAFVKNFPCIHDCAGCFVNSRPRNPILTLEEIWKIVDQAQELGDESVKFLGPGELLINPRLFEILDEFSRRNLVLGIFTKGAVMGNDMLSYHYHGISSEELVQKLVSYPNVTFLIGGLSFDPKSENRFVPRNKQEIKVEFDYHQARNLAIERLCHAGMNTDLEKPRLAIVCSPVTAHNIGHVAEIYKWGAERNIPVYLPPTMVSGKGHKLVRGSMEKKFEDDYIALAVEVYTWAIERGVMTLEQFKREGPHPYIGVAPCNQLTHGLYVHCDGAVWRCPGNDTPDFVVHNDIRDGTLLDIWRGSKNYRINKFNNGCVKDGVNLPRRFYREVRRRVKRQ
jgi:MoaA/NifB/PqqE/SkfB family radical SAM enzyme